MAKSRSVLCDPRYSPAPTSHRIGGCRCCDCSQPLLAPRRSQRMSALTPLAGVHRTLLTQAETAAADPDRTQTRLAGCEIAPVPPGAASAIRYLTIRVWLVGI